MFRFPFPPAHLPLAATLASALVLGACSFGDDAVVPLTREEVVALYEASGLSPVVAECVVGTAERSLPLADLPPSAVRSGGDALLIDEAVVNCESANDLLNTVEEEPEELAYDAGLNGYGSDPGFDALWDACAAGDGSACDELWETAPVGSVYEEFGVTCGRRMEILDCSAELVLDEPDGTDTDGASTDGASTDGASTDGASTDGASTDGTDG